MSNVFTKIKLEKKSENHLNYQEIEIIDRELLRELRVDALPHGERKLCGNIYEYRYLCVVTLDDGSRELEFIYEDDLHFVMTNYSVKELNV